MKSVRFHIGPHKTATTRIQACLGAKSDALEAAGINYRSVKQISRLFKGKLQAAGLGRVSVDEAFDQIAPRLDYPEWQQDDLVLSFENAVGVSRHTLIPGDGGYAQLERRLSLLTRLFADRDLTLFFAVRRYDKFMDSAYSEAVRARFDQPARALGTFLATDHIRWPAFLDRVRDICPTAKVVVWQHEDYRAHEAAILARLSGGDAATFASGLPEVDYRVSLSRDAVTALLAVHPYTEFKKLRDGAQDMAEAVAQAFPVTDQNPPVSLWSDDQRSALMAEYTADVATLKSRKDIEFLGF
ncbi:MAG: hypothetical protein AAGH17_05720 [Pseudomonadota bacterium]